jgi:uncharacterized protein YqhQ
MPGDESRTHIHVGGQAVIEGVMMRSPDCIATAVRTPEREIVIKAEPYESYTKRYRLLGIPVLRGGVMLIETFVIAVRALGFSAEQAAEKEKRGEGMGPLQTALTIVIALFLGVAVFFYLPLVLTEWIGFDNRIVFNLVDGAFRLAFLFLYIFLITRWKEMRRIFEYHGAEHKTIFAFEEKGEVTVDSARRYPTAHPRCSTSFLLLVVIVSIILFIMLGRPETIAGRAIRFAFIPVIGGISYELLRLSARPRFSRYMGFLIWPGLFMQRFTAREPSSDQLEVAVAALKACLGDKVLES